MRATLSVTRSRAFSLRVPIASESERALFQKRLWLTLMLVFVLSLGFFLTQLVMVMVRVPEHMPVIFTSHSVQVQLATTSSALVAATFLRRAKKPSAHALSVADVVTTVGLGLGWAAMIYFDRLGQRQARPELVALLATSYTLATRAALVPSTTARSALVGMAALAPLVPITYAITSRAESDAMGTGPLVYVVMWSGVCIGCTTTISHVIYGLRLQVRKAMQLGQYLLEDKIGEGGMGVVYRASHAMLRRPCAIKLLTGSTGQAAERFEREVQMTARLTHPNTVVVFDYGRTPEGVFYYAMEYLEGITLEDLVHEFGAQPASRVVHILLQVCGALDEAHAVGLVHRDIKPSNIMLTERGRVPDVVKVLDFGLVKETEQDTDPGVSSTNVILGTPHYMAPEAIASPMNVDSRTDLYAIGATAFYLLTGQHVFEGANLIEICSQHLHQPPPAPSEKRSGVPAALDAVVLACLAKNPEERPDGAAALAERLRACKLPEWTLADARPLWERQVQRRSAARPERADTTETTARVTETVMVALEDRGAA